MRAATIFTAAFAAAVMASPVDRRDEVIVTATDVDYVTDVVTVTAGQDAPATSAPVAPAAVSTSSAAPAQYGHKHHKKPQPSSSAAPAPAPTTSASQAPAPPASSSEAPASSAAPSSYSPPSSASSSAAPPPASSSAAAAPSGQYGSSYQSDVLLSHNLHRANYTGSGDLTWDQSLADAAQVTAKTCTFAHQGGVNGLSYGQNIAAGTAPGGIANIITGQFYNAEVEAYNLAIAGTSGEPAMTDFENWGHMSQVVWAGSNTVGCYTYDCRAELGTVPGNPDQTAPLKDTPQYDPSNPNAALIPGIFTVCNYGPAGNVDGEYRANIGSCADQATAQPPANANYGTSA